MSIDAIRFPALALAAAALTACGGNDDAAAAQPTESVLAGNAKRSPAFRFRRRP